MNRRGAENAEITQRQLRTTTDLLNLYKLDLED